MSRSRFVSWDSNRGQLVVMRDDPVHGEMAYEFRTNMVDAWDSATYDDARLYAQAVANGLLDGDIYFTVDEGDRFVQRLDRTEGRLVRTYTDDDPPDGATIGWTFRLDPRLRSWRPDAPGLHIPPPRSTTLQRKQLGHP